MRHRLARRRRQAQPGGDVRAELGVDPGQHGQCPLLDRLLVDLAELEGVRRRGVHLLDLGQAGVEQRRVRVVVVEGRRRAAHHLTGDLPRHVDVAAGVGVGDRRGVVVDAVGLVGREASWTACWWKPSRLLSFTGACGRLIGIWVKFGPPSRVSWVSR
jgi:hypothetical protein